MAPSNEHESMIKKVMILGGSGNLGPHLIPALTEAGFRVTVLSRRSPPTNGATPTIQSDYSFPSFVEAFKNQDAVVCAIATLDVSAQRTIVDAAVAAGVKRYMPSEYGSDTSVADEHERAGFLKSKQEVMGYIKTKEAQGLTWTALFTGAWIDWLLEEKFLDWDLKAMTGTLYDSGNNLFTVSTISTVANAVAAVLLHPEETRNQLVHVSSFELSQNLVKETIERISGKHVLMGQMSLETLYENGVQHVEEGDWAKGYKELVAAAIYKGTKIVHFPDKAEHWNSVLGIKQEETFDEVIKRVLAKMS